MEKIAQIIILSDSKTEALKKITENCLDSLEKSEKYYFKEFEICVVDNKQDFKGVKNFKIEGEFNYNKFMNTVAKTSNSEWIVFCNNDLIFMENWFTELMKYKHDVMSVKSPPDGRQIDIKEITFGNVMGKHFSGWCFAMKRSVYNQIGGLNEDYTFWCSDNVVIKQLEKIGILPCLVPSSNALHLRGQTLKTMSNYIQLTAEQLDKFNKDYN